MEGHLEDSEEVSPPDCWSLMGSLLMDWQAIRVAADTVMGGRYLEIHVGVMGNHEALGRRVGQHEDEVLRESSQ